MINTKKIIACLYAGIVAACAMEGANEIVRFNGTENADGCDYIKFDVKSCVWGIEIEEVSIDKDKLLTFLKSNNLKSNKKRIEEITLVIPAYLKGGYTL